MLEVKTKPSKLPENVPSDFFEVESDIMDVSGHIPKNGDTPFIDNIWFKDTITEDSTDITTIPEKYLRKGHATQHILSILDYFNKKDIKKFEVQMMSEASNKLMESLARKGHVKQLSKYKFEGDDVTYEITPTVFEQLPPEEAPKEPSIKFERVKTPYKPKTGTDIDDKGLAQDVGELEKQIKSMEQDREFLDVNLQLFADANEKLGELKKTSKLYENTLPNIQGYTKEEQMMFNQVEGEYTPRTEKESLEAAKRRLETNYKGEVKKLREKDSYTGVDFDTAMGILESYKEEGRLTGNYNKMIEWARIIRKKGSTEAGRTVQAHAKYSRTPENVVMEQQKKMDDIEKEIEKTNPKKTKDVEDTTKVVDDAIKEAEKQAEKDVSGKIAEDEAIIDTTPKDRKKQEKKEKQEDSLADKLAKKIISNTDRFGKPKKKKEKDVLDAMIDELYSKHKEMLPKDIKVTPSTKYKEMANAIKLREISGDVWVQAKKIVEERFKGDKNALKILDEYFGYRNPETGKLEKGTRPPFSQKLINQTVKNAMKKL